jgi:hypothetical protein
MSKAVNGTGTLRKFIIERLDIIMKAWEEIEEAVSQSGPTVVRRNFTLDTAKKAVADVKTMIASAQSFLPVMEMAVQDHSNQATVVAKNLFNRERRRTADGQVKVVDQSPVPPHEVAALSAKLGIILGSQALYDAFVERASNPHTDYFTWSAQDQRQWLTGGSAPSLSLNSLPSAPAQVVILQNALAASPATAPAPVGQAVSQRRQGKPATDAELTSQTWQQHKQAISMFIRRDFGGKDMEIQMRKRFVSGDDALASAYANAALESMLKFRDKLQSLFDSYRLKVGDGPGQEQGQHIIDMLTVLKTGLDIQSMDALVDGPLASRNLSKPQGYREFILGMMEHLRSGSEKRASRRLNEMLRRCRVSN